jgi:DNA-binding FrmR family transcriptional regulator
MKMELHSHVHKDRKQIVNRLAKIEGHVRSIKEMTQVGRDFPGILLQIAAVPQSFG